MPPPPHSNGNIKQSETPLDIVEPVAEGNPLSTKERAFRIEINNTYGQPSKKTISYHQEIIITDGADGPRVGGADKKPSSIVEDFDEVYPTTYTFIDPVVGQEVTISMAGVAIAVNLDYVARRQYQKQVEALDEQLAAGDITQDEYEVLLAALVRP